MLKTSFQVIGRGVARKAAAAGVSQSPALLLRRGGGGARRFASQSSSASSAGMGWRSLCVAAGGLGIVAGAVAWREEEGWGFGAECAAARAAAIVWGRGGNNKGVAVLPEVLGEELFGGRGVKEMGFGESVCVAVDTDGNVWQWGSHLGPSQATKAVSGRRVARVCVGSDAVYALTSSGGVVSWDPKEPSGVRAESVPGGLFGAPTVVCLSAQGSNVALVTSGGDVYAKGRGGMGQLGTGGTEDSLDRFVRMEMPRGERARQVAVGGEFAVVVTASGRLFACGADNKMQLGRGRQSVREWTRADEDDFAVHCSRLTPVVLPSHLEGAKALSISCGETFSAALVDAGGKEGTCVVTWGEGRWGQLGHKQPRHVSEPKVIGGQVLEGKEWDEKAQRVKKVMPRQVACGLEHCVGLLDGGKVVSWGGNRDGEVGSGGRAGVHRASLVMSIQDRVATRVFAGGRSSGALA